jgi:cell division protein FtsZ
VQGISDIITTPGLINRDFSDIRTIMSGMGYAMMGTATASGENAAVAAAEKAISCPLLEAGGVSGARGVLVNITGSRHLRLHEVNQACSLIRKACANDDVEINFGVVVDENMGDEVKVTVIATGFQRENLPVIHRRTTGSYVPAAQPAVPAPVTAHWTSQPEPEPEIVMKAEEPEAIDQEEEELLAATVVEVPEEAPRTRAAAAAVQPPQPSQQQPQSNAHTDTLFDELEVPAILRRERRFLH